MLLVAGAVSVAARLRFKDKLGRQFPNAMVLAALFPYRELKRWRPDLALSVHSIWDSGQRKALIGAGLAASYLAIVLITIRWFEHRDTFELRE